MVLAMVVATYADSSKRRRVETRSKKRVVMPSAAVCIELGSTLWPAESERFTDGVCGAPLGGGGEGDG